MSLGDSIKDEAIVRMLSILKDAGVSNQIKTLHELLLIYESVQIPSQQRELIRTRLEDSIKLIQRFQRGDKSVRGELKNRKIL
jgi:hypothetical protein